MTNSALFLVGAGRLPEMLMRSVCLSILNFWGGELVNTQCGMDPNKFLMNFSKKECLVRLCGDSAIPHENGQCWLEALGAWKKPVLLLVASEANGDPPGAAAAYAALCKSYSVPLVGLIQIDGIWKAEIRRADGLPWCGWMPGNHLVIDEQLNTRNFDLHQLVELIRIRTINTIL